MKHILCTTLVFLLAGCAAAPADTASTPALTPAATAAPTATPEAAETPETADGEYDAILLPQLDTELGKQLAQDGLATDGYYTMSRNGKWGLMTSDGTVLLPCLSVRPVGRCASGGLRWHYLRQLDDSVRQTYEDTLAAAEAGVLCTGEHDGLDCTWTYDVDTGQVCKSAGQLVLARPLDDEDAAYGDYLPCLRCIWYDGEGDPNYYKPAEGGGTVYANADGVLLTNTIYEDAGCFYDQPLAPVKIGGKWAYINLRGEPLTDAVYDPVYGGIDFYDDYAPKYASPFLNQYAAVCRDDKWGVLDATGAEYIPCVYEGAAWNGHILWLKQNGHWQSQTLPGVPEHWQDVKLRFQVGPQELHATDTFWRVTAKEGLRLRVGPGTSYEKIGVVPKHTDLQELGRSADGGWMLTLYGKWHGWVSMEYLEPLE